MRHLFTVVTFCCALGIASPCKAAPIEIGSIFLFDFGVGAGAQLLVENTSGGVVFDNRPIEEAFTNILLTVSGVEYAYGRIGDVPDFYPTTQEGLPDGLTLEALLPGSGVSFLTFDPTIFMLEATVAFSFGAHQVTGGGPLMLFESIPLFVDIPEAAPVPEPGTLLLLSGGLALAVGRRAFRRHDPTAR
jgi:hypothetical protein